MSAARDQAVVFTSIECAHDVIAACAVATGNRLHELALTHPTRGAYALTCKSCIQLARAMPKAAGVETMIDVHEWHARKRRGPRNG